MNWDIKVLLSSDENLGHFWSLSIGFKSLGWFVFNWDSFQKSFLNENFIIEMKSEIALKTTLFHWVTVSKPLGQNWIMRYLWKDNIQIFHLTPSGPIYHQYFFHTGPFYKLRPIKKWENGKLDVHIFSRPWFRPVLVSASGHPVMDPLSIGVPAARFS